MENKHVGWLIVSIAIVMAIIVFMFNAVLEDNLDLTCSHGPTCEMHNSLNVQTWISYIIIGVIFVIALVIMFSKPKEKIIIKHRTRTVREKKKPLNLEGLNKIEKKAVSLLQDENGVIFQKTLMEKLEIGKVGMTRLLDKLEAKQIIERKRRGMNNVVVFKN